LKRIELVGYVDVQFRPSIRAMEAILPAPKACAGRAKIRKIAMVNTADEMLKEGMFAVESVRVLGICRGRRELPFQEENVSGVRVSVFCSNAKGLEG
jgi:hypothetical protein